MTFVKSNSTHMIHRKLSFVAIIWPIVTIYGRHEKIHSTFVTVSIIGHINYIYKIFASNNLLRINKQIM